MIGGNFHSRDGFYFQRLKDGSVRIRYAQPIVESDGSPAAGISAVIAQTTLPANEWASVLASVGAEGETAETWQAALDRHLGDETEAGDAKATAE